MIVLEDGTGVDGANSYITVVIADAYHSARGNATWTEASTSPDQGKAAAIVRACASLDAMYGSRFSGYKTNGRDQRLMWPRTSAYDAEGIAIASTEIPQEVMDAQCELALRELVEAGSTVPDIEIGGPAKRLKAGSVEIERFGNYGASPVYQLVDGILAPLLGAPRASFTGYAIRG